MVLAFLGGNSGSSVLFLLVLIVAFVFVVLWLAKDVRERVSEDHYLGVLLLVILLSPLSLIVWLAIRPPRRF